MSSFALTSASLAATVTDSEPLLTHEKCENGLPDLRLWPISLRRLFTKSICLIDGVITFAIT